MSMFGFMLKTLAISPLVFLRFLPIFAAFVLVIVALFMSTDNPYVIFLIMLILATYGVTFVIITGIRGGLVTLRVTAPPTASAMLRTVTRMFFSHMLVLLVFSILLGGIAAAVFYFVVLPAQAPAIFELLQAMRAGDIENAVPPSIATLETLRLPLVYFGLALSTIGGICVGLLGVPMAAMSANAVQKSPQNDLIYGFGRHFAPQFVLYMLVMGLPSAVYTLLAPATKLFPITPEASVYGPMEIGFGVFSIFASCVVFSGTALGYKLVREKVAEARRRERVPEIDYAAERENLKNLRQTRTAERGAASRVYVPQVALASTPEEAADAPDPDDPDVSPAGT